MPENHNEVREALKSIIEESVTDSGEAAKQVETCWSKLRTAYCTCWEVVKKKEAEGLKELGLDANLAVALLAKADKPAQKPAEKPKIDIDVPKAPLPTPPSNLVQNPFKDTTPSLPADSPGGCGSGQAMDLRSLTMDEWESVLGNCMALNGRDMRSLKARTQTVLIAPRNPAAIKAMTGTDQLASDYQACLSFSETFAKHAQTCDFRAFAKVTTPFVSAASEYRQQTDEANVRQGSKLHQVIKYVVPVGEWEFRPDHEVLVDEEADKKEPYSVNPDLDASFRKEIMNLTVRLQNVIEFNQRLEKLFKTWGDVVCTHMAFGLAMHSTKSMTCDSEHRVSVAKEALSIALKGGFAFVDTESGVDWGTASHSEMASRIKEEEMKWTVIGGLATGRKEDLNPGKHQPMTWRCIHQEAFEPITRFLKKDLRDQLAKWEKLIGTPEERRATPPPQPAQHEGAPYYIKDNKGSYYHIDDEGYFKPGEKGEFSDVGGGILVEHGRHRGKYMYASSDNGYICGYSAKARTELSWTSGDAMHWYGHPVDVYKGYFYSSGRWYTKRDYKFTKEYKQSLPPQQQTTKAFTPAKRQGSTYFIKDNKGNYYHIDDRGYFKPGKKGEFKDMNGGILVQHGEYPGKYMYASADNGYICGYSSTPRTELSWTSGGAMLWYNYPVDLYDGYFYSSGRWYTHRDYKFTKEYK